MSDSCGCSTEAGNSACELPAQNIERKPRAVSTCPECGKKGKPVDGQTVKAMLSASLREVKDTEYFFCKTETCPIVYFSMDGSQTFSTSQIRERVFQKESTASDINVCYCFRHTVGDIQNSSGDEQKAMLDDINAGIKAEQCACDLRNPQGSCCLGNVRAVIQTSPAHA
ncbi:MAG: hypothetical protein CO094_06725 [Anaerolineae bacterium CG_4_9_14_3_um_filter_57_17]|nr:MAG: hypothetical protein CO094_06725 [Anaerolineae bacterium CG_4_9_14_3_um_filter_57_17]